MPIWIIAVLFFVAFLTALISGFLGMGGGMVLLGVMATLMPANAVVPIHGVVQLSSNGTRTLLFLKDVRWRICFTYIGPAVIGLVVAREQWPQHVVLSHHCPACEDVNR